MEGADYAAALAPAVDRLALCIHRPTGARPDVVDRLRPLDLPPRSFVVGCARPLAAGRVDADDVLLMSRYAPRRWARSSLDDHVERGLLSPGPKGVFLVSEALCQAAGVVLRAQAEEAARLWEPAGEDLSELAALADAHVRSADGVGMELPAFRRQVGLHHVLPTSTASQLLGRVTELRYLRSDAHAAGLAAHGLSGPPAQVLHRLWRGFGPGAASERTLAELADRSLCRRGADGWAASEEGARLCETVEGVTNELVGELLDTVGPGSRERFLTGLGRLPGADPRPDEDR